MKIRIINSHNRIIQKNNLKDEIRLDGVKDDVLSTDWICVWSSVQLNKLPSAWMQLLTNSLNMISSIEIKFADD